MSSKRIRLARPCNILIGFLLKGGGWLRRWRGSSLDRGGRTRSFRPGVRILISKSFCGPFLVEIFKLISAGSIFCDNFHFSKFCAESQERCWKRKFHFFSNFNLSFSFNIKRRSFERIGNSQKKLFAVFQSFIFFRHWIWQKMTHFYRKFHFFFHFFHFFKFR